MLPVNYMSVVPLPVLITCFVATEKWLDANADTARKFQKRDPDITKIDPKIANRMSTTIYPEGLNLSTIAPAVQVMFTYGYVDKPVNPRDLLWP